VAELDPNRILILDFGSQYTMLIARRIREQRVYCEIHPFGMPPDEIRQWKPRGIILSGGPSSVYDEGAPRVDARLFELGVPMLGICYGMQLMALTLGGGVERSDHREYGRATLQIGGSDLFRGFDPKQRIPVWMSHGDRVAMPPDGFGAIGKSENSPCAAMADRERNLYGVQFHPEVVHTPRGEEILGNFLFRICRVGPTWTTHNFVERTVDEIRERIGDAAVICGLSGGVDSSVTAVLLQRAVGERLTCIFVDNGVLRKGEADDVVRVFRDHYHINLRAVDAGERFLARLAGLADPEEKRKVIGNEFIAVFEEESRDLEQVRFLAQGTLYPDVIESVSFKGPSATIKSHHNVGGLPERMDLELVEPLRELFKDEVRAVGAELGLPRRILHRHPFPGPGLAVRIIGEVTAERVATLQEAEAVVEEEIRNAGLYDELWQSFAVLLPVRSVGVMGDERTYEDAVALRAVTSLDGMTADWAHLPPDLLGKIGSRIINEVKGVNRVVYDISSKPPATIEWE